MRKMLTIFLVFFSFIASSQVTSYDVNEYVETYDTIQFDLDQSGTLDFEITKNVHYIKVRPLTNNTEYCFELIEGWSKGLTCNNTDIVNDLDFDWIYNAYPWFPYLGSPEGWGEPGTYKLPFRVKAEDVLDDDSFRYGYIEFEVSEDEVLYVKKWYINNRINETIVCDSQVNDSEILLDTDSYTLPTTVNFKVYDLTGKEYLDNYPTNIILVKVYENGIKEKFIVQ